MSQHIEWLNLIDRSGAFLEPGVLDDALPQGLEGVDSERRRNLLSAYDEWREAVDTGDADAEALHRAWIDFVLKAFLEYDDRVLLRGESVPETLSVPVAEHGGSVRPGMTVMKGDSPQLLVDVLPPDTDLDSIRSYGAWNTSALDRMVALCRGAKITIGLVTNGERWLVVHVPEGGTVGHASWYGRIWRPEPVTLRAFQTLLGVRRCFGPQDKTLSALLSASLEFQDEVTDTLGQQVRRAVEVLIQSLDRADHDRHGELLKDVEPRELYEAGLTVMMRLVFLLCAEERGLLLLGEGIYDQNYAISTLRAELREWQSRHGDQVLERRHDAWSRLLATFRAVFGGVTHETLRMPALGGSLFDPDRFPFLEGRSKGSSWRQSVAAPLPIDNRTVLLLLSSLQVLEQRRGARLLSYKALDVEQIGHVYEGLLECTVLRLPEITLGLEGVSNAKDPNVSLVDLERAQREGEASVLALLTEVTGRSESALRRAMTRDMEEAFESRLLMACGSDTGLLQRVKPWANLLRKDIWNHPLVYRKDAFAVTLGSDRRETGTHYTPKPLTERIVQTTLEPLVYVGPSDGKSRETWTLKTPYELLDLKVCDPAMGSGAFLVQVCRYLGDRLVESWSFEETLGKAITVDGEAVESLGSSEFMPTDPEERAILAKRLVAERCLYGIDINPMAVELAKLSIWLVTLAKGRPFGFLDHNLRCGDSLLGVHRLDQLTQLRMDPGAHHPRLFGQGIERAVSDSVKLRSTLRNTPIRDIRDIEAMAALDIGAKEKVRLGRDLADIFIGIILGSANQSTQGNRLDALAHEADSLVEGTSEKLSVFLERAKTDLAVDAPNGRPRKPFHWPLEFPEVFVGENSGFDACVGNPPFSGGRLIGRRLGLSYQEYLKFVRNGVVGSPDLCAFFFLRSYGLLNANGCFGLLATKTITETGSRIVCLDQIIANGGTVIQAISRFPWPGDAAVVVSIVWVRKGGWFAGKLLDDRFVDFINGALEEDFQILRPIKLKALKGRYSEGQHTHGRGFELTRSERDEILNEDPGCSDVIFPLFDGQDLNSMHYLKPYRWVIYFRDWTEKKAREYIPAFRRVETLVKPYRASLTGQIHQSCFWKFWDLRPVLIREAAVHKLLLASATSTKYATFRKVSTSNIYNKRAKLYFLYKWWEFAVLQSSLHHEWAFWNCGTLGASTLTYSTSNALETWPMPEIGDWAALEELGERYHTYREELLSTFSIGLTQLYNRFHDAKELDPRIQTLRDLHRQIDLHVLNAYGWDDLDPDHDFHSVPYLPENDRIRFTFSEHARLEVLRRLASLNHVRYQEEVAAGLHGGRASRRRENPQSCAMTSPAPNLFGDMEEAPDTPSISTERAPMVDGSAQVLLAFLRAHSGWHGKSDVIAATGLTDGQWNAAIAEVVTRGLVERQGERRGARYQAMGEGA